MSSFPCFRGATFSVLTFIFLLAVPVISKAEDPSTPPPPPPEPATKLDTFEVVGRAVDMVGFASTASQGSVGYVELEQRPFLRRGELLEVIPGVVITQHSGSGKANQYYLRGFNLDHGTDLSVSVEGMPVNLPTNGHGQGYADINFLIPEFVQSVDFNKGPFYPEVGDFSAAGAANYHIFSELPHDFLTFGAGSDGYARMAFGETLNRSGNSTTIGIEAEHYNGPWTYPDNFHRYNLMARQVWNLTGGRLTVTAMGYTANWNSTDQIPLRAVQSGLIGRFGALDPSDGGNTRRASLNLEWLHGTEKEGWKLSGYAIAYHLDLFSNFTFFLDDPIHGDQFNQHDNRTILGGALTRSWTGQVGGMKVETVAGWQMRDDQINVGLFHTEKRVRLGVIRDDKVQELGTGAYTQTVWHLSDQLRIQAGGRIDWYNFKDTSDNPLNSGERSEYIISPKLGLVYELGRKTELYANAGYGFHSNDARGTVIKVDPKSGDPADPVPPLVRSKGIETGIRTSAIKGLVSTFSVWALDLDSELVLSGDSGGTEASGATRRYGIEMANYYRVYPWLVLDLDVAFTHARYKNAGSEDHVAESIGSVITGGVMVTSPSGWHGSARLRYFGNQPLIEDNSVAAPASATVNLLVGYDWPKWQVSVELLNALNRENFDIGYYYTSRLRGEPADGVDDVHFHPAEPRMVRFNLTRKF